MEKLLGLSKDGFLEKNSENCVVLHHTFLVQYEEDILCVDEFKLEAWIGAVRGKIHEK